MGQTKSKGRQRNEQTDRANERARYETSGLIDPRLRKALSHELRVQILTVANQREVSPSEFSEELNVPLSNVSYHFRKLLEYDCIELTREVPVRGSHEHRYVGTRRGLISDGDWAQLGKGTQAGVRIAGFQDLINRCTQAVEGETFDAREDAAFYWVPMSLDEIGWKKMQAAIRRVIAEVEEFEVERPSASPMARVRPSLPPSESSASSRPRNPAGTDAGIRKQARRNLNDGLKPARSDGDPRRFQVGMAQMDHCVTSRNSLLL